MKTKTLSLILALVLCLGLLPSAVLAAGNDFTIENGVLTKYNGKGGDVTIPNGVTQIGDRAFYNCKSLKSVTIPDGVTYIGAEAFSFCTGMKSVTIPNSVTFIQIDAFSNCESLKSVDIPSSVTGIGMHAFANCTSLTSVTIPSGLTNFGRADAFIGTPWLASLGEFPTVNGVLLKYFGQGGIVTVPSNVTEIGGCAFSGSNVTSVTIPNSVTDISAEAFQYCTSLTSVIIPSSLTYIGVATFDGCKSLKSVTVPSSVTKIVSGAFNNCESLTDIYYGGSKEQWNTIDFMGDIDEALANATIHYNSPMPDVPAVGGFTDVKTGAWFAEPVKWAVEKGITTGTSATTFSPNNTCTKAHILTFLWRAKGEPAPTVANPFSDVKDGSYYYNAALWAYENGLVSGSSFSPNSPCTRAQTVTYQWKLAGSPAAPAAAFTDVSSTADYAAAVGWAVEKGITTGTSATTFSPNDTCTRGQIVTFLYRDMGGSSSKPAAVPEKSSTQLMAQAMLDKISELGSTEAYLLDMNADGTPELVCYEPKPDSCLIGDGAYRVYRWDGQKLYEHQFDYKDLSDWGGVISKCRNEYALVCPIVIGTGNGFAVCFLDHTDTLESFYDSPVGEELFCYFNNEKITEQRYNQLYKEYGLDYVSFLFSENHTVRTDLPDARTELNKLLAG